MSAIKLESNKLTFVPTVTRLEVIDDSGRAYVLFEQKPINLILSLQDGGRTLKVFCKGRKA